MSEPFLTAIPQEGKAQLAAEAAKSLSRLLKSIHDYSKWMQARYGVSGPQLWVLWELRGSPGITLSEVAERVYLHPSTVSGITDRLEAKGLVTRIRRRPDRRLVRLQLTPEGMEMLGVAPTPMRVRMLNSLQCLPDDELSAVARGLSRLVEVSRASDTDASRTEGALPTDDS